MAWTPPKTWVSGEDVDFTEFNTHVRDNFNETAPGVASASGRLIVSDGVNSIAERLAVNATVTTTETTTSTTFTDLATAGPAVTVTSGTAALVIIEAWGSNNNASHQSLISYAISGATTASAGDVRSTIQTGTNEISMVYVIIETLTAGSNTFTAKYRTTNASGTASFRRRRLVVVPF